MDKKRKEQLRSAIQSIREMAAVVERLSDQEQDCVLNYPENLQGTERFSNMEESLDDLYDAQQHLDEALELLCAVAAR